MERQQGARHILKTVLMGLALCGFAAPASADLAAQRSDFVAARKALARGDTARYRTLRPRLDDYILAPYLDAAALERRIDRADADQLRAFLARHPELPVVWDLRRSWLRHLARERRWQEFLNDYRPQSNITLRCQELRARIALDRPAALTESNQDLWLFGESRPKACDPVFAHWRASGALTEDLVWQRAVLAVTRGEYRLAGWLARPLPTTSRQEIQRWIALRRSPDRQLERAQRWPDTPAHRRMLAEELQRLSRSDPDRALEHWNQLEPRFRWSQEQRLMVPRTIALLRATDYPVDALQGLYALPSGAVDLQIQEWRVRVALHQGDWPEVLAALNGLPETDQARDRWRYWRARAEQEMGRTAEARELYQSIALEPNYYGFLAAERVGLPYTLCPRLRDADPGSLGQVTGTPAFQRAIELFHVDQRVLARREWAEALKALSPELRRVAAILADAEGWYGRSILTLANAGFFRQYTLRFPLAWNDRVTRETARRKLNPSLVYGVMRSESAMVPDAVSSAGARGLMQLTPSTGRQVARRYGLPSPNRWDLLDPYRSIALGSAYLDQLFREQGHPLLALASYNAGPDPVKRWQRAGMPVEPDRWIETVPYHETREYLSRVLAFATIYDWRRHGRMVPLRVRMPDLDQRPGKSDLNARPAVLPVCHLEPAGASIAPAAD